MKISENTLIMKMTVDPLCEHCDKIYALPAFVIRTLEWIKACLLCARNRQKIKVGLTRVGVEVGSTLTDVGSSSHPMKLTTIL